MSEKNYFCQNWNETGVLPYKMIIVIKKTYAGFSPIAVRLT